MLPWGIAFLSCLCLATTLWTGLRRHTLDLRTLRLDNWSCDNPRFIGAFSKVTAMPLVTPDDDQRGLLHLAAFTETRGFAARNPRSITLLFDVSRAQGGIERPSTTALLAGEITDLKTGQRWVTAPSLDFRTEQPIEFFRAKAAAEPAPASRESTGAARWQVELRTAEPVLVGIRSHAFEGDPQRSPNPHPGEWVSRSVAHGGTIRWIYPIGSLTVDPLAPPVQRADLIAGFWEMPVGRLWTLLAAGLGLFFAGVGLLARSALAMQPARFLQVGLGTALIFLAAGGIQLLLRPAFQGPDEQNHVGTVLLSMDDQTSLERYMQFGRRVHFDRLYGRPLQKLTSSDLNEPADFFFDSIVNWGDNADISKRSAMHYRFLAIVTPLIRGLSPGEQVVGLRFLGLGVVTAAVLVAAGLLSRELGRRSGAAWAGWCFLVAPSIAFFASCVSNYSLLVACYVLGGTLLACLVHGARVDAPLMFLLGLVTGVMVHASITGVVMVSTVGTALMSLALFPGVNPIQGAPGTLAAGNVAWRRWAALAGGLLLPRVFSTPGYDQAVWNSLGTKVSGILGIPSIPYSALALVAVLGLALLEQAAGRRPVASNRHSRRLGPLVAQVGACLLVVGLVFNAFAKAPQLGALPETVQSWDYLPDQGQLLAKCNDPLVRPIAPSSGHYVQRVLASFMASWGPGDADYMTSRLFWEINGDLDNFLPRWIRQGLTTMFSLGLVVLLWRIGRQKDLPRLGRLSLTLLGIVCALALLAYGTASSIAKASIHGRYLIGIYLFLIPLTYLGCLSWISERTRRHPVLTTLGMTGVLTAVQTVSILNTLSRYYG